MLFCASDAKVETRLRGFVVTKDCISRQRCQAFRISTSEHYIFRLQRILQLRDNIEDVLSPLLLSQSLQSRSADVLFETSSILVRKVSQFGSRTPSTISADPQPVPKPRKSIQPVR
jgi:hypothetical protein